MVARGQREARSPWVTQKAVQARRADRTERQHMSVARSGFLRFRYWSQGRRAPLRFALAPGYLLAAPFGAHNLIRPSSQ